ncbi:MULTISPECIES: BlaI/MecI/CopY family transcriptional regulator [Thermomonospora]|uniref:Transcriptional repressor, CopY family n=1 Tax=Thermomonospora curvata (strain ATCC 19995 / DSM 43183 / JCM 3096 / KCTC 9072 / NBRC 15933 / NCIMB 10081 / Henssen B9) TaxID=471852 RepID=D1A4P2_THECD|nr:MULTISPECIES: BlaI/MecI/CopY family transcriptional regulator [Thermomonospora]ACY96277.1 transcriptional repressor, CopY family [Thermomonospora curvata DSM 43183]PKK15695.1 MAG: CopY family transcriptional regulator [Thermomonospora sp. CIF 1]
MKGLGELERTVMEVLWARQEAGDGAATARDVSRALAGDRDLAHTTVMTVLDRLTKKGFLVRERDGRAWRYQPAASRESYVAELMLGALNQTGDRDAALTHFVRSVSQDEIAVLRQALEELTAQEAHARVEPGG